MLKNISRLKKRCYLLMGFENDDPEKAHVRAKEIFKLGFLPFAQFYQPPDTIKKRKPVGLWAKVIWYWSRVAAFQTGKIPDEAKQIDRNRK